MNYLFHVRLLDDQRINVTLNVKLWCQFWGEKKNVQNKCLLGFGREMIKLGDLGEKKNSD